MQIDYTQEIDPDAPVTEQAAAWWMLLNHSHATSADHRAFRKWVVRSPECVEAFLQTVRLTRFLQSKHLRWSNTPIDTLVREARNAAGSVVDLRVWRHRCTRTEMHSTH